jgi:hypothetical protein
VALAESAWPTGRFPPKRVPSALAPRLHTNAKPTALPQSNTAAAHRSDHAPAFGAPQQRNHPYPLHHLDGEAKHSLPSSRRQLSSSRSLCSARLSLYSCRHRRCSLKSPWPPPSYAQGPPLSRSLPRAAGRREAEVADAEFFVRRKRISDASLLWRFPGPAEPLTSFAEDEPPVRSVSCHA